MTNECRLDRKFPRAALFLLVLVGCAGPPRFHDPKIPSTGRVEEPHLATLEDGRLAATWALVDAEGHADIVLTLFDPEKRGWGPLRRVNPAPGSAVAGRQVGPRMATGPDGTIVVTWVDRERDPAGDILLAISKDAGRTFSTPRRVNTDSGRETGQEYHDVAVALDGTVFVVWLDERDAPADYENQKQLYVSVSKDGGCSFSADRALTSSPRGVCPCCRPSLVASSDGSVHIIYRDREDELLFIRVRSLRKGDRDFSAPVTLSKGWRFPGCPVNAPAIETGPEGKVWALWVEDGQLRWGRSDDRSTTFTARGTVAPRESGFAGAAAHLALAFSPDSGAVAIWEDAAGQICFLALPADGDSLGSVPIVLHGSEGVFAGSPAIESANGEVYVCWGEDVIGAAFDEGDSTPRLAVLKCPTRGGGAAVLVPMATTAR